MLTPPSFRDARTVLPPLQKTVAVLGSTGSIGRSAVEIIIAEPQRFAVRGLVAHSNVELLAEQAALTHPAWVVITDPAKRDELAVRLKAKGESPAIYTDMDAVCSLVQESEISIVLAAIVGFAGLPSVLAALRAGKTVALANKESLVAGGELVRHAISEGGGVIIPVDSEHSALYQSMQGDRREDVASLVLTASGGPFRKASLEEMTKVTVEQALQHPRWKMGPKVTIDSSTLMNKALELIEAHWLFEVPEEAIEVVIHPQSIVHSLVRYIDGSILAQLSVADMKGPIAFALGYPEGRMRGSMRQLDLTREGPLEFFDVDLVKFPAIPLARECLRIGGSAGVVLNAANEIAVERFLRGELAYLDLVPFVRRTVENYRHHPISTYEELHEIHARIMGSTTLFA